MNIIAVISIFFNFNNFALVENVQLQSCHFFIIRWSVNFLEEFSKNVLFANTVCDFQHLLYYFCSCIYSIWNLKSILSSLCHTWWNQKKAYRRKSNFFFKRKKHKRLVSDVSWIINNWLSFLLFLTEMRTRKETSLFASFLVSLG